MLEYCFFDMAKAGIADGVISVSNAKDYRTAKLFWADDSGILIDYLIITQLELTDSKTTYEITGDRSIPATATRLVCELLGEKGTKILDFKLPKEKLQPQKVASYRFFLLSDTHGGGDYWQNKPNRDAAFSDVASFCPSHIIVSGDITNAGQPEHYEKIKADVVAYFPNTPVLFATGNHDYNSYRPDVEADSVALKNFFDWQTDRNTALGSTVSLEDNCYFTADICGVRYLFLNTSAPNNRFEAGEEQRHWLEQNLSGGDKNSLPSIVINHFPITGKTGLHSLFGKRFMQDNDEIEAILNRHQCIYVSGHTHYNLDSDDSSVKIGKGGKPTYLNAGCVVWTQNGYDENGKDVYIPERSMGLLVEVFNDCLLIRGRDFTAKKFIPKCEYRIAL